jgi:putative SOS response-associated peptidase YedK
MTVMTEANEAIHNRMPAILDADAVDDWLFTPLEEADRLRQLLVPTPVDSLAIQDAHPSVGNVRNDGLEMLRT